MLPTPPLKAYYKLPKTNRITVNELMAKTDCTISQARKVIDEIEFSDD